MLTRSKSLQIFQEIIKLVTELASFTFTVYHFCKWGKNPPFGANGHGRIDHRLLRTTQCFQPLIHFPTHFLPIRIIVYSNFKQLALFLYNLILMWQICNPFLQPVLTLKTFHTDTWSEPVMLLINLHHNFLQVSPTEMVTVFGCVTLVTKDVLEIMDGGHPSLLLVKQIKRMRTTFSNKVAVFTKSAVLSFLYFLVNNWEVGVIIYWDMCKHKCKYSIWGKTIYLEF